MSALGDLQEQEVTSLLGKLQDICRQLERNGEDVAVFCTSFTRLHGTTCGTEFFESDKLFHWKFKRFCQDKRKSDLESSPTPVLMTEAYKDDEGSEGAKDIFSLPNTSAISLSSVPMDVDDDLADDENVHVSEKLEDIIVNEGNSKCEQHDEENKQEVINETVNNTRDVKVQPKRRVSERNKDRYAKGIISNAITRKMVSNMSNMDKVENVKEHIEESITSESSKSLMDEIAKVAGKTIEVNNTVMEIVTAKEANISNTNDEEGNKTCFKCGKIAISLGRLREHLTKKHKIKIGHKCLCRKFFISEELFERHISADSFKTKHSVCLTCDKFFKSNDDLKDHFEEFHKKNLGELEVLGDYPCGKCGTMFEHEPLLLLHTKKFVDCDQELKTGNISEKDMNNMTVKYRESDGEEITLTYKQLIETQTKEPYFCIVCKTSYTRKSNFKRHLTSHFGVESIICEICGMKFKSRDGMVRHVKEHYNKPYHCDHCRGKFSSEQELKDHFTLKCKAGNRELFKCDLCGYKASSLSALASHKNTHNGLKLHKCTVCGKCMATVHSLERHRVAMHSKETRFTCPTCQRGFKTKDNYKKHLKTHELPKYHCDFCGKGCVELGNLKKHLMCHTKEKPFVCEICGKAYSRKSLLDNHRRLHTGEKPYKCPEEGCSKGFRSYSNLKQHIRSHSTTNPYVCDVCGKTFKQPGRLNHHRKDHSVEYRWPCLYCEMKFKSIFMYKNHLAKTHPEMKEHVERTSNIRLYQCTMCNKMYGDKEDLTRHIYVHKGLKPFKCSYCSKAFNDKSNMKQHEKIHTGEKSFVCEICSRAFLHKKTLKLHIRNCHMEKPLKMKREESVIVDGVVEDVQMSMAGNGQVPQSADVLVSDGQEVATANLQPLIAIGEMDRQAVGTKHDIKNILEKREVLINEVQIIPAQHMSLQNLATVDPVTGQLKPLMIVENFRETASM